MADSEVASSSGEPTDTQENDKAEEFMEPEKKRRKVCKISDGKSDKLEQRLGGILCCAVCLDLPRAAVYQVCFWNQLIEIVTVINTWCLIVDTHRMNLLAANILSWFIISYIMIPHYHLYLCQELFLLLQRKLIVLSQNDASRNGVPERFLLASI
jgi:hypothetical protein